MMDQRKYLNPSRLIGSPAFVLFVVSFGGKALGFFREVVVAGRFGTSSAADAFIVAATIPGLMSTLVGGVLATSFIPLFVKAEKNGRTNSIAFTQWTVNAAFILLTVMTAIGMLLSPWLVRIIAPGLDTQTQLQAVQLCRIMFPTIVFLGLVGVASGFLNGSNSFVFPALSNLMYNVILIGTVLAFGKYGIYGVAWATLGAAVGQFLFLFPRMVTKGFTWAPRLDMSSGELGELFSMSWPIFLGTLAGQMDMVVDRMLGSSLSPGSLAALNYANRLAVLPPSLFLATVLTMGFPRLSEQAARNSHTEFAETFVQMTRKAILVMTPIAIGTAVLRTEIIRVVYERNSFSTESTSLTATVLLFYSLTMLAAVYRDTGQRALYAMRNTKTPVTVGIVTVALTVLANLLLVPHFGLMGMAVGTTAAVLVGSVVMYRAVAYHTPHLQWAPIVLAQAQSLAAAGAMGTVIVVLRLFMAHKLPLMVTTALLVITGVIVYAVTLWLFGAQELLTLARHFGIRRQQS